MKRLLTRDSKEMIRQAYESDVIFETIKSAYKDKQTQMTKLRFSPEEIWVNCFYYFDQMLKTPDRRELLVNNMWNDCFNDLRDEANDEGRPYEEEEMKIATSCVIYTISACLSSTKEYGLRQYFPELLEQIENNYGLRDIYPCFNNVRDSTEFDNYINTYIDRGKYIRDRLENKNFKSAPIIPRITSKNLNEFKEMTRKKLEFMKGYTPDGRSKIMSDSDFNKMMEAVEYLIENRIVKKQETKINTTMKVGELRYVFYLIYNQSKNQNIISRKLCVDFLVETFEQMKGCQESIYNHFSDKPEGFETRYHLRKPSKSRTK